MVVRIVLADKEPIGKALRRFKKLLEQTGQSYEMRRRGVFLKSSQELWSKDFKKRFKARRATLIAQVAGKQPVASVAEAQIAFWKKTGKP
ncbi:MAG TPA: bS21 family ribosomal protein [Gemmatales bacterium]|nr:bS21 family ribosomal protein [Gemmatales bacterium]